MRLYKSMIKKKRLELLVCLSQQTQYEITFKIMLSSAKRCWSIFGVGYKTLKNLSIGVSVGLHLRTLKAVERALDLLDLWLVGRCEWLPVGRVETQSPPFTHTQLKPHACPGSSPNLVPGLTPSVSTRGSAAGSQRVQPLAVIRSSSGPGAPGRLGRLCNPRVMQLGAGGACGGPGGGGGLKVLPAHLAQLGALAFLSPGFVLTAVSIPPVTPRVIPDR